MSVAYGVVSGRFSHSARPEQPPLTAYAAHVTGWSPTWLDRRIVPRVWNLTIDGAFRAVLRIDADPAGGLQGRLKVFHNDRAAAVSEELEDDLSAITWDGRRLAFTRSRPEFTQTYVGNAASRFLEGTFQHNGGPPAPWGGVRAEVLSFGLGSRGPDRASWQVATRTALVNLTEGMRLANRDIPSVTATEEPCVGCPFINGFASERDDDASRWPANYSLRRFRFSVSPGSRFDSQQPPPARVFHGYLATPVGRPPPGGYPCVVAVNGHWGSAQSVMTSNDAYWYGESAARRGFVVLAIDIGHRSDDPVLHPAIVDTGYGSSNWEEDGERAFSVRRAIDWLCRQPNVRRDRILMMGLSLGGEVTTITTGLDPRIVMAFPAGYAPDMYVMDQRDNHPCYRWTRADIHEYVDVSDYLALAAPRMLVVETGLRDRTFSSFDPPWAADKQVVRRALAAYGGDSSRLLHYLHDDGHAFHVGGRRAADAAPRGVTVTTVSAPSRPGDASWQTDSTRRVRSPSIYHLISELFP